MPIIIDVDGHNIQLTSASEGVDFDFAGSGRLDRIAWTVARSNDGWLVLDRNHSGIIDDGTELFGNTQRSLLPKNLTVLWRLRFLTLRPKAVMGTE